MKTYSSQKSIDRIRQHLRSQNCPEEVIERVIRADDAVDLRLPIDDAEKHRQWQFESRGHSGPISLHYGPARTMKEIPAGSDLLPYPSRYIVHQGREHQLNPRYNGH